MLSLLSGEVSLLCRTQTGLHGSVRAPDTEVLLEATEGQGTPGTECDLEREGKRKEKSWETHVSGTPEGRRVNRVKSRLWFEGRR